jgi:hypothetical protein
MPIIKKVKKPCWRRTPTRAREGKKTLLEKNSNKGKMPIIKKVKKPCWRRTPTRARARGGHWEIINTKTKK